VPLNPAVVGRPWAPVDYEVGVEKVREFRTAIGAPTVGADPAGADPGGADADPDGSGAGVPVPPTFAIVVVAGAQQQAWSDPELGLDFSRVVHRDQRFVHHRPIAVGDRLSCTAVVDGIQQLAGNDVVTLTVRVVDETGSDVCTATSSLVARAS
jgi:hypothetical protein